MNLGERIDELRRAKGLTHGQLAERAGISRSYVTRLQTNRVDLPSKRVLWSLADALSTTPGDLLVAAGYLRSRDRILRDAGLEIAFKYVATLPEAVQREILDFVADVSLHQELPVAEERNAQDPDDTVGATAAS